MRFPSWKWVVAVDEYRRRAVEVETLGVLSRANPLMADFHFGPADIGQRPAQPLFSFLPVRTAFEELDRDIHGLC